MSVPTPLVRALQDAVHATSAAHKVVPKSFDPNSAPWVVGILESLAGHMAAAVHTLGVSTLWVETGRPDQPYLHNTPAAAVLLDGLRAAHKHLRAASADLRYALDAAHELKTAARAAAAQSRREH